MKPKTGGSKITAICPGCGIEIHMPVHLALGPVEDGNVEVVCSVDNDPVWRHYEEAHMLTTKGDPK